MMKPEDWSFQILLLKGNKQEINLSSIQTGNYVITIETEKQTINKKLIQTVIFK